MTLKNVILLEVAHFNVLIFKNSTSNSTELGKTCVKTLCTRTVFREGLFEIFSTGRKEMLYYLGIK